MMTNPIPSTPTQIALQGQERNKMTLVELGWTKDEQRRTKTERHNVRKTEGQLDIDTKYENTIKWLRKLTGEF